MSTASARRATSGEQLAAEASRYLHAVAAFASPDADPHAHARDRVRPRLAGKTPEQTITATLAVGSKPGGPFKRVDKGTYTLADATAEPKTPSRTQKPKRQPTRRRQAAKSAQ
jgi:hypothetical protein